MRPSDIESFLKARFTFKIIYSIILNPTLNAWDIPVLYQLECTVRIFLPCPEVGRGHRQRTCFHRWDSGRVTSGRSWGISAIAVFYPLAWVRWQLLLSLVPGCKALPCSPPPDTPLSDDSVHTARVRSVTDCRTLRFGTCHRAAQPSQLTHRSVQQALPDASQTADLEGRKQSNFQKATCSGPKKVATVHCKTILSCLTASHCIEPYV